jgi:phosphatidate phosphatase APP1
MATPRTRGVRDSGARTPQDSIYTEGRERGTRRRKLAGYLKAANDLRQSYQQTYAPSWSRDLDVDDNDPGIPGAFPDVAIVRNGDEEMMLFPSYARRHVTKPPPEVEPHEVDKDLDQDGPGDAESWRKEWERHEDSKAIVDVDVRGWIYSPHRGPTTRKNRLLIGIARRLSGMPAPTGEAEASDDQHGSTHQERVATRAARKEEELVLREAESITKRGDGEADVAWRGGYSEEPAYDSDGKSNSHSGASTPIPNEERRPSSLRHSLASSSIDDLPGHVSKRTSWSQPADMSDAELRIANAHLMARLKPFLSIPHANTPITVFFYNHQTSQSRTILTNEAGHFSVRAALDFVPTDVRVLASEGLSATDEVTITEPRGVSLISDIDDTIKHSAVGSGAREIFRNTFIRDLGDLTIEGVKDWYKQLADLGVKIHYVSNSPWQLFPLLSSYFTLAGLPPGSFHLKQYSGMLQGIFEPVAERKKSTLEKIMRDFPERRFLLVGDSGEADLEVYTDVVLSNPNRILGVFIRDMTTPPSQGFFDSAMGPLSGERHSEQDSTNTGRKASDGARPSLPARPKTTPVPSEPRMGTLIDLDEDSSEVSDTNTKRTRPPPPAKPKSLQSLAQDKSVMIEDSTVGERRDRKPPPLPPKPPQCSNKEKTDDQNLNSSTAATESGPPQRPLPKSKTDPWPETPRTASAIITDAYSRGSIRQKVASAYNSLPSATAYLYGEPTEQQNQSRSLTATPSTDRSVPPPPRRNLTSYPAAAAQYASSRLASSWAPAEGRPEDAQAQINKKEDMWKRRWAKAKQILDENGVELRGWRVGEDVMNDAVELVKKALEDQDQG